MRSIKNNVAYLTIIKYSKWFMLFMPIVIKFYGDFGFSMKQIMLLQSIYSLSMLLFEVPSGYSADILGRRFTLIIGTVLGCLGFAMYSFAGFFWQFALAEIILGIGMSFVSGADSAMLYDSLYDMKKESDYAKYEGRVSATGNFAEAMAGILGSAISFYMIKHLPGYGRQSVYLFQTFVAFTGIPASFLLIEPKRHALGKKDALNNILKISRFALFSNRTMRYNILFSSLIGSATLTMAWFIQKVFIDLDITNDLHHGYLWAGVNVIVGISTLLAYKIDRKLGSVKTMLLIAIFIGFGYVTMKFETGYFSLVIIFIFYIVRGIATPVLKDYINRITSSEVRATILSLRSFIIRIIFLFLGPVVGWLSDIDLRNALFYAGLFYLAVSLFLWSKIRKLS